jgi:hypothetical protein
VPRSLLVHVKFICSRLSLLHQWPKPTTIYFYENHIMTKSDGFEKHPESLSLARVYRLIELEQIEMEKRVAENRKLNCSLKAAA